MAWGENEILRLAILLVILIMTVTVMITQWWMMTIDDEWSGVWFRLPSNTSKKKDFLITDHLLTTSKAKVNRITHRSKTLNTRVKVWKWVGHIKQCRQSSKTWKQWHKIRWSATIQVGLREHVEGLPSKTKHNIISPSCTKPNVLGPSLVASNVGDIALASKKSQYTYTNIQIWNRLWYDAFI